MWNKEDEQQSGPNAPAPSTVPSRSREQTRIGASVTIEGTMKSEEDLRFEGRLKGSVSAPSHHVVIGSSGQVNADVHARVIEVDGRVKGDLVGVERVVVNATGNVVGNLRAPRVSLENGAQFKGSIDMDAGAAGAESGGGQRKGPRQSATPAASPKSGAGASAS